MAPPERAAPEPPPPEPAPPQTIAPDPVVPPPGVTKIETPFSPTAWVVAPVDDPSPVVLFADEARAIRRRVVARLAALGYEVVPFEELERIETAAASGKLVLEGDRTCRVPLSVREVSARYFADAPTALTMTSCGDDCFLHTVFENGPPDETRGNLVSRKVKRPHDPVAWAKAADSLDDRGAVLGFGHLGAFGGSHPPPIMFGKPDPFGPWAKPPDGTELDTIQAAANMCAHPDPHVGFDWSIRVAVAKSGRIDRCHASSVHTQARTHDAECLCDAIATLRYPQGKPGRRLRIPAIDDGGFRPVERSFRVAQAGTDVWVARVNEAPALDVCETRGVAPSAGDTRVELDLKPDGTITAARVFGTIGTPESIAWARCLTEELPKIPLPCSPPGVDTLHLAYGPA